MEDNNNSIIKKIDEFENKINGKNIDKSYKDIYNETIEEIEKIESIDQKNKLLSKLSNIYQNRIKDRETLLGNISLARQTIEEFEEMKNMVNKIQNVKEDDINVLKTKAPEINLSNYSDYDNNKPTHPIESASGIISDDGVINPDEIEKPQKADNKTEDKTKPTFNIQTQIKDLRSKINNNLTKEELSNILEQLKKNIFTLFEFEQFMFMEKLKNASTVESKLDIIKSREGEVSSYSDYLLSDNTEINQKLLADDNFANTKKQFQEQINLVYKDDKEKGEYCWNNFEDVKNSSDFINSNIFAKNEIKSIFCKYLSDLKTIIKYPSNEAVEQWKNNLKEYVSKNNIDADAINPYLNAVAKLNNSSIGVDKDFNITGLNLTKAPIKPEDNIEQTANSNPKPNPEKEKVEIQGSVPQKVLPPHKERKKVTKITKIKGWIKKHYKVLILGLALSLVIGAPIQMMVNSALYNALGYKAIEAAPAFGKFLHSVNLALAKLKTVGLGQYQFNKITGLYTLGGGQGALPLYNALGANFTALLLPLGSIGAAIAGKIKLQNREYELKRYNKKQQEETNEIIEEEIKEKTDETIGKDIKEVPERFKRKIFPKNKEQKDNNEKNETNDQNQEMQKQIDDMKKQMEEMQKQINRQREMLDNSYNAFLDQGFTREAALEIINNGGMEKKETKERTM